jgi:Baseplate J-like protein
MPLTLRPKDAIVDVLLSHVLAGNIVTDVSRISVIRQLCEGVAATQADLDYSLYTLLQGWYITSAEGQDLDIRLRDYGLARDVGQAASDPVVFTTTLLWVDDIALPAPQVVQATLADGTEVLYRSIGDHRLLPAGRSVSSAAPGVTVAAGVSDSLALTLDGDGVRTLTLGTQTSGTSIAAAIQAQVRALIPINPANQPAYTTFRCDYGVTTPGAYTLRSGTVGPTSSVVVTVAASHDAAHTLKLGVQQGGLEQPGQTSVAIPVVCDTIGVLGNVGAGQINVLVSPVPGIAAVANPLAFANGRAPASDDAYRQDGRNYLLALGRGTKDAIERAVAHTVGADGQRHVMTSQVAYGAGSIQVWVCDGRSVTVGAQSDVIQDVQDELDGLGQEIGGWVPGGNVAGVAAADILTVDVDVEVFVGPSPDLARAQQAIRDGLYHLIYGAAVGQVLSTLLLDSVIDSRVAEVFNIVYTLPLAFATNPASTIGGTMGTKPMPGILSVRMTRI